MPFWDYISASEGDYIRFLKSSGCFQLGRFRLKEPKKDDAPYSIDVQESFDSEGLRTVGHAYVEKICELPAGSFDLIVGPAEKGTALGVVAAPLLPPEYGKISVFWDRKVPKDYGTNTRKRPSWFVGPYRQLEELVSRQEIIRPVLVDDVITSGRAKRDTMSRFQTELEAVSQEQHVAPPRIKWVRIIISANRREVDSQGRNPIEVFQNELGVPIAWITDSYNIYGYLHARGQLTIDQVAQFVEYQSSYGFLEDKERLFELSEVI